MFPEPFRPRLLSIWLRREEACTYKNIRPAGTSRCIQPVYHHFALRPSNLLHRLPSIGDVQHKLYLLRFICVGFSLQKNQTMSLKLIQLYIRYFEICCEWIGLIMNNLLGDFHSPMPYFSELFNRYLLKFTMLTRWRYQHTWYLSVLGQHRIIKSCQNRPKSASIRKKVSRSVQKKALAWKSTPPLVVALVTTIIYGYQGSNWPSAFNLCLSRSWSRSSNQN